MTINDDDFIHFLDFFSFKSFMSKKRPISLQDCSQWWWSILTGSLVFALMTVTKILRVEPKLWKLCSLDQSRVLLESSALRSFCFPAQTNLFWTLRCLRHGFWLKIRFRPSPLNYYQNSDERPGQQRELLGQFHGGTCWFLQPGWPSVFKVMVNLLT